MPPPLPTVSIDVYQRCPTRARAARPRRRRPTNVIGAWQGRPASVRVHCTSGERDTRGNGGGFCTTRSLTTACRRRVAPLLVQFPPFGGGVIGKQAALGPARALCPFRRVSHLWRWGFCSIRSFASACRRRVVALLVQFPPFGGGEVEVRGGKVAVWGGVAPKVQTTSAKNADNGVSWARWSTFWAKLSRTWCVVRTRTPYCER